MLVPERRRIWSVGKEINKLFDRLLCIFPLFLRGVTTIPSPAFGFLQQRWAPAAGDGKASPGIRRSELAADRQRSAR